MLEFLQPAQAGVSRRAVFIALGLAALAQSACTRKDAAPEAIMGGLAVQLSAEPASLDPMLVEDGVALQVLNNVMDGLVGYDGAGELKNRLAESYRVSADGKRYSFRLRPGAVWSDGKSVTAQHFVDGIQRSLAPGSVSKLADLLRMIREVRAEKEELIIELHRPTPYFIQALTLPVALPVRKDFLAAHGDRWTEEAPVTGPYRIAARKVEQQIRLEPNPRYWNPQARPLPVTMQVVVDESTAVRLFENGRLDILTRLSALELEQLRKKGRIRTSPFLATYYLGFNLRKAPFKDRDFRRAVSGSIRREEIVAAMNGGDAPARGWIPNGLEGALPYEDPARVFETAAAKVRETLETQPLAPVEAGFDRNARSSLVLEKVQQDLHRNLGLELRLNPLDWKSYLKTLSTDAPPVFRFAWMAPFLDPITHLQVFTSGNPNNYGGWSNAEYDRLVSEVAGMAPGKVREAKIRRAQRILVEDEAACVPIYHYVQNHAVSERVEGFRANPFNIIRFEELGLKP